MCRSKYVGICLWAKQERDSRDEHEHMAIWLIGDWRVSIPHMYWYMWTNWRAVFATDKNGLALSSSAPALKTKRLTPNEWWLELCKLHCKHNPPTFIDRSCVIIIMLVERFNYVATAGRKKIFESFHEKKKLLVEERVSVVKYYYHSYIPRTWMHLGTKLVIAADAISLKTPFYCSNWFRGIPKFVTN